MEKAKKEAAADKKGIIDFGQNDNEIIPTENDSDISGKDLEKELFGGAVEAMVAAAAAVDPVTAPKLAAAMMPAAARPPGRKPIHRRKATNNSLTMPV